METCPLDKKFLGNSRNNLLEFPPRLLPPLWFLEIYLVDGTVYVDVHGINLPAGEDYEEKVGEDRSEVDHLPRHPHALPDAEVDQHPG